MNSNVITAPRVDIVGSFLPPEEFEEAIEKKKSGAMTPEEFAAVEDSVIDRLIDREMAEGLHIVTDGEIRRKAWDRDFWEGFEGVERERIDTGRIYQDEPVRHDLLHFSGRILFNPSHPFFDKYVHMLEITAGRAEARQTMPSPGELYVRVLTGSNGDISRTYPSPDTFIDDIIEAYRLTIDELYRLGCRHIQFDSSVWGRLSDPDFERKLFLGGMDPDVITANLIEILNRTITGRPADLEVTLSIAADETRIPRWDDEREQTRLADMLEKVDADSFVLPFDINSPAQLDVLRLLPESRRVTLGLVDGSLPGLERIQDIVDCVHVAMRHIPLSRISLSPTCGFKVRDRERQGLNYESQWTKISLPKQAASTLAGE